MAQQRADVHINIYCQHKERKNKKKKSKGLSLRPSASYLSVSVRISCWAVGPPPDAPQAAETGCWSGGGSPESSPCEGKRSTGRAMWPGWISSSPWRCACRHRPEGLNRTAENNGEEPEGWQRREALQTHLDLTSSKNDPHLLQLTFFTKFCRLNSVGLRKNSVRCMWPVFRMMFVPSGTL